MDIRLKRAYEPAGADDGYRVLIDRLWPRGVSRARAELDAWEKELSPSAELRQWFGHAPERFEEFRRRYIDELRNQRPGLAALRRIARAGTLTLVYSAHDSQHNDAVVLAEVLRRGLPIPSRAGVTRRELAIATPGQPRVRRAPGATLGNYGCADSRPVWRRRKDNPTMLCYPCAEEGIDRPAVALCRSCTAGLCTEHLRATASHLAASHMLDSCDHDTWLATKPPMPVGDPLPTSQP